jgi:hypothetical protein
MELMVVIANHNWSCCYTFLVIEGRPSLSWRVVINFVSMIYNIGKPALRLQRHQSFSVEKFRRCASHAITFALKASADAIIAGE